MKQKKKAILLSRVSTLGQDLQQQTNVLIDEAQKLGYDYNNIIIIENKESGITLDEEDRQGLNRLKELISENIYDCVICYEISRIARNPSILYNIRDLLVKNKIQLIIIKPYLKLLEDDYTISHTTNLLFSLYSSFSENEMIIKKERMLRGKQHKRNLNLYTGGRILYGYKVNDKQKIVINETESNTVKLIFDMYKNNNSISTIYQELYDLNITQKTYTNGIVWVYNILKNSSYCGDKNNKYKYEPIISKQLFNETQKKLQSNKQDIKSKSKKSNKKLLILGLLYYRLNNENKRMYSHTRSNCNFYTVKIENNNRKSSKFVNAEIIDTIIWDIVKNYKMLHFNDNNKILLKEYKETDKELTNKINTYKPKILDIQNQIDKLEERLILGKISEDKAEKLEEHLYNELKQIKQKINNWQYELETIKSKITNLTTQNIIPQPTDFNLLSFDEKQLLTKDVIKRIIILDNYNSSNKKRYTHEIDIIYNTGQIKTLIFESNNYIQKGYTLDGERYLV